MKKVIFMLAFVLMSGLSFANNSKVHKTTVNKKKSISINNFKEVGVCSYSITRTIYYPDGTIEQETRNYTSYAVNLEDCKNQAKAKLTMLEDGAPF